MKMRLDYYLKRNFLFQLHKLIINKFKKYVIINNNKYLNILYVLIALQIIVIKMIKINNFYLNKIYD